MTMEIPSAQLYYYYRSFSFCKVLFCLLRENIVLSGSEVLMMLLLLLLFALADVNIQHCILLYTIIYRYNKSPYSALYTHYLLRCNLIHSQSTLIS